MEHYFDRSVLLHLSFKIARSMWPRICTPMCAIAYSFFFFCLLSLFLVQQIGCYMGFSIHACVIAGVMFICYCIALDEFATIIRCYNNRRLYNYYGYNSYYPGYYTTTYYDYCSYYGMTKSDASSAAGLGACLLVCAVVETVIALTASIYCCNAVCCGTTTPSVSNKFMQWSIYD